MLRVVAAIDAKSTGFENKGAKGRLVRPNLWLALQSFR